MVDSRSAVSGIFRSVRGHWQTVVTVLSLLLAVVAIVFGFYWYFNPRMPSPVPMYAALPNRSVLINGAYSATSGLGVTYDGKSVSGHDVTAVTFYFWNDGLGPMRDSDVLSQFEFVLPPGAIALDARVLAQTRSVCGMRVEKIQGEPGKVAVGFKILEHGDGATIQVIYAGESSGSIQFLGAMVGAASPTEKRIVNRTHYAENEFLFRDLPIPLLLALWGILLFSHFRDPAIRLSVDQIRDIAKLTEIDQEATAGIASELKTSATAYVVHRGRSAWFVRLNWVLFVLMALLWCLILRLDLQVLYFSSNQIPQALLGK